MPKAKLYEVYDLATGNLLATGTSKECSESLGISCHAICDIAREKYNSRKFRVVDITPPPKEPKVKKKTHPGYDGELRAAANRWEAFCAPIRKKYGIPVYKAPKKEGGK